MTGEKPVISTAASLDWGVRLLYLQSVAMAGFTVYLIVLDLTSSLASLGVAASLTVLAALAAVVIFFVARALGQRKVRARGPAVVVQLFLLATGGFLVQVGPLWLGVVLLIFAAITALLVLLPASGKALGVD